MRAIAIEHTGGPDVLHEVEVEVGEPGAGEVRVRHHACGVNFIDTYHRSGLYPLPLPAILGVEAAGVVEAVGAGVTHLAAGDRVAYAAPKPGSYSEVRLLAATPVVRLPDTIDFERGVARLRRLAGGRGVRVLYDSVGKDTWERSLDCVEPLGLVVSFGNASGPVPPVNLGVLAQKGSLYVTRPTLFAHLASRESAQ